MRQLSNVAFDPRGLDPVTRRTVQSHHLGKAVRMYRDVAQWVTIRRRVLDEGISRRQITRETGIDRETVNKMLAHPLPQPCRPRRRTYRKLGPHIASLQQMVRENIALPSVARLSVKAMYERLRDEGFLGGYSTVKDHVRLLRKRIRDEEGSIDTGIAVRTYVQLTSSKKSIQDHTCGWEYVYDILVSLERKHAIDLLLQLSYTRPPAISQARSKTLFRKIRRVLNRTIQPDPRQQARYAALEWMRAVLQKDVSVEAVRRDVGDLPELRVLLWHLYGGRLFDRNKSMAVLSNRRGVSGRLACAFLGIHRKTYCRYIRLFEQGGAATLFASSTRSSRKFDDETVKKAVFSTLHEPPATYGINRTSWRMTDLCRILREKGQPVCGEVVRKITKAAGWKWRKARVVLTSSDPEFSVKLDRIRTILSGLQPDEAFFSIDEFGPVAVKMKGGMTLTAPGEQRIVPQWQKSRGCLIVTAALELSGNQVTHFYSERKNTAEMIRMMEVLLERYGDRKRLYLSWDAASWHISKKLYERVDAHNAAVRDGGGPTIETAPLPARAQFLNVIESVFSGMARAVIHGSDYKAVDVAKAAIDRYFAERNAHFVLHPRRAGKKIWGKEREPATFSASNNCKDPRYYR